MQGPNVQIVLLSLREYHNRCRHDQRVLLPLFVCPSLGMGGVCRDWGGVVKMVVNCMIVGREKKCELVRLEVIDEVSNLRVSRAFLTVYLYFSSSGDF